MNKIHTETIGECWIDSIKKVMNHGDKYFDEDVEIKELLGLSVQIDKPKLDDTIINAFGDSIVISRTLEKFSKGVVMPDRPFTYGERIYNKDGVDQFEWLVDRLNTKKESKSSTISLLTTGSKSANLPCLTTVDAKIRKNKLVLQFFFRSQNIFGRQYANLLALVKLQKDLAERCSVEVGNIKGYVASAHIYEYDFKDAQAICMNQRVSIKDKYYSFGPKSIRKSS